MHTGIWLTCSLSSSPPRAFKINELKAEVADHLAGLEKRVEREWVLGGAGGCGGMYQDVTLCGKKGKGGSGIMGSSW